MFPNSLHTNRAHAQQSNALSIRASEPAGSNRTAQPMHSMPKTVENIHRAIAPLSHENWLEGRAEIVGKQPNLSKVVAVLDMLMPRQPGESAQVAGYVLNSHSYLEEHLPQSVNLQKNAPSPLANRIGTDPHPNLRRLSSQIFSWGKAKPKPATMEVRLPIDEQLVQMDRPVNASRNEAIQRVLGTLLVEIPQEQMFENRGGAVDLSEEGTTALIHTLLPHNRNEEPDLAWRGNLESALATPTTQAGNPLVLHENSRKALLDQPALFIELVSLVDSMCQVGNPAVGHTTYPICSEEQFADLIMQTRQAGKSYLPTMINGVSRHIDAAHIGVESNERPWSLTRQNQTETFANKENLIQEITDLAAEQIAQPSLQHAADLGEILPLPVYQVVSQLNRTALPAWVQEMQSNLRDNVNTLEQVQKQVVVQRAKARAELEKKREHDAQQEAIRIKQRSEELGVPNNADYVSIAASGSSRAIETRSFDTRILLEPALHPQLETLLAQNFMHMNMAHNARGLKNVKQIRINPRGWGFMRDNQCWLRASWVSAFEQIQSPEDLANRIQQTDMPEHSETSTELVTRTIFQAYSQNPLQFLHHGEEDTSLTSPAHFRTGQTMKAFCEEFGLPDVETSNLSRYKHAKAIGRVVTVEGELKYCMPNLLSGIRSTVPEIHTVFRTPFFPLASSDIPSALHRALGLRCIVVENSGTGQVSIRVSGSKGDSGFHEMAQQLSSENLNEQAKSEQLTTLLNSAVPVIYLQGTPHNDGHYTVFLPHASRLGHQMLKLSEEQALTRANAPERKRSPQEAKPSSRNVEVQKPIPGEILYASGNRHLLANRNRDISAPLHVLDKACELNHENPVIFDFVGAAQFRQSNHPNLMLSQLLKRQSAENRIEIQTTRPKSLAHGMMFSRLLPQIRQTDKPAAEYQISKIEYYPRIPGAGRMKAPSNITLIEFVWKSDQAVNDPAIITQAQNLLANHTGYQGTPVIRSSFESRPQAILSLLHEAKSQIALNETGSESNNSNFDSLLSSLESSNYLSEHRSPITTRMLDQVYAMVSLSENENVFV